VVLHVPMSVTYQQSIISGKRVDDSAKEFWTQRIILIPIFLNNNCCLLKTTYLKYVSVVLITLKTLFDANSKSPMFFIFVRVLNDSFSILQ